MSDFISSFSSGVDGDVVFDVGYANHSPSTESIGSFWTHSIIKKSFSRQLVVGIDPVWQEPCDSQCTHVANPEECKHTSGSLIFALNVLEHVPNPQLFISELSALLATDGKLVLSTPNPSWIPHLYDWLNLDNSTTNVDHVAIFGPSEIMELAERANLSVLEIGYFGRGDMVKSYRPGPGLQRVFWALYYGFCRVRNMAPAHNQIFAVLGKA